MFNALEIPRPTTLGFGMFVQNPRVNHGGFDQLPSVPLPPSGRSPRNERYVDGTTLPR